ncbi:MAG: hypothetical protein C4533_08195 [Candidatus Omnitrophota bacterium]|jgi:hypothetical protein|nr:MAG: hypothetical protein C4533_08195 [Candidatus Omnitrophota bacterium]
MFSLRSKIMMVLIIGLFININYLNAAWWDQKGLPVPAGAVEQNHKVRSVGGIDFDFKYYETNASIEDVISFYRNRLPKLGWKEFLPHKELDKFSTMPNVKVDPSLTKFSDTNLLFMKDNKMLAISFIPEKYALSKKTKFAVAEGLKAMDRASGVEVNAQSAHSSINFAPQYPGSNEIGVYDKNDITFGILTSKDSPKDILAFYKEKMPDYGWTVSKDNPVENISKEALMDKAKGKVEYPDLAMDGDDFSGLFGSVYFVNSNGDKCEIGVFRDSKGYKDSVLNLDFTTIMIKLQRNKNEKNG